MSYTPTNWTTGDTITVSAMNKIENGIANAGSVATVFVDTSGMSGTQVFYVGYAENLNGRYSIESPLTEYFCEAPYMAKMYIPVPLTFTNDTYKPYILWGWESDEVQLYEITGNISTTKITAQVRVGLNSWQSGDYKGFEIMGDGTISVSYYD